MKYNSIGEQLIAKAQELDPNYKSDKFNDMSEALDIILKSVGSATSVFDATPYLIDENSISVEGYNALKEFVSNNYGSVVKINMGSYYAYYNCALSVTTGSEDDGIILYTVIADDMGIALSQITVTSDGHVDITSITAPLVIANSGNGEFDILSTITIGVNTYSIPNHSNEINSLNTRVENLENSIGNINILFDEINGEVT